MSITAAIIGTGYIGRVHLETLLRIPGVKVAALADSNLEQAQRLAERYGIAKYTADYRTLVDDANIQVFHNCTPNHLHFEINKLLLENRKHVFSEKPLSLTSRQAKALCDLARETACLTAVNFCYRYYPVVQEAAARIKNDEIGRVQSVFGAYFQDWLLYESDYNWRLDRKFTGASNSMADIGSHWLDLAQFVTGCSIVEVMADLHTILPQRKKAKDTALTFTRSEAGDFEDVPVDVDDYGSVLLHFDNGARGAFSVCQLCAGRKCSIDLQCYGSRASLAWNHEQPACLWLGRRDEANEYLVENPQMLHAAAAKYARLPAGHPLGYYDAVYNLFADFYEAVAMHTAGVEIEVNFPAFEEGLDKMLILEAILTSQREKRWVQVERMALQKDLP